MIETDPVPVAIVTGGATGIGAAVARMLAGRGWRVAVDYRRSAAEAEQTREACEAGGGEAMTCRGDVSKDDDCRRIVEQTLDRWDRVDALVNNAGTTRKIAHSDLEGVGVEDFERIMGVNVMGVFLMSRAAAPALRRSGRGAIVNVSSDSAFSGAGSSIPYVASKGAVNTMTLSLARVLAPEVRVNAVCPGYVDTRWLSDMMEEREYDRFRRKVAETSPLGLMVRPDDVADAVVWFIEGARAVTGQTLVIDAGNHLATAHSL